MQSVDEFELTMKNFIEMLNQSPVPDRFQQNCKYFAQQFSDLLRENFKLKDQIIENLRNIEAYRQGLIACIEEKTLKHEMANIEQLLYYVKEDKIKILNKVSQLQDNIERLKQDISNLNEQAKKQSHIHDEIVKRLNEECLKKIEHQIELGQSNEVLVKQLKSQQIQDKDDIDRMTIKINQQQQEIEAKTSRIKDLMKDLQQLNTKIIEQENKYNNLFQDVQKKQKEEIRVLKHNNKQSIDEITEQYQQKIKILDSQLDAKEQEKSQLLKIQDQLEQDLAKLNLTLIQLQQQQQLQIEQLNDKFEQYELKIQLVNKQNESSKIEIKRLNTIVQEQTQTIQQQKENNQHLEQEIFNSLQKIVQFEQKLQEQNEISKRRIENLKQKHSLEIQQKHEAYQNDLEQKLTTQQKDLEFQAEILMKSKMEEINRLKQLTKQQSEQLDLFQFEKRNIGEKYNQKIQEVQGSMLKQITELQIQIKNYQDQESVLNQKIIDLQKELQTQFELLQNEKLESISKLQKQLTEMSGAREKFAEQIKLPLSQKIGQLSDQLSAKVEEIAKAKQQFKEFKDRAEENEKLSLQKIRQLEDEIFKSHQYAQLMNTRIQQKQKSLKQAFDKIKAKSEILVKIIQLRDQNIKNLNDEIVMHQEKHLSDLKVKDELNKNLEEELGKANNNTELVRKQLCQQKIENEGLVQLVEETKKQVSSIQQQSEYNMLQLKKEYQNLFLEKETNIQQLKDQIQGLQTTIQLQDGQLKEKDELWNKRIQQLQVKFEQELENTKIKEENQISMLYVEEQIRKAKQNQSELFELEKSKLIIKYEEMIDCLNKRIQQQQVIDSSIKDGHQVLSLNELLIQEKLDHEKTKDQAERDKDEMNRYINLLKQKYDLIVVESQNICDDANLQKTQYQEQLMDAISQIQQLKSQLIEEENRYNIEIDRLREQGIENMMTITENCQQELDEQKQRYTDLEARYEMLKKLTEEKPGRIEDQELINKLKREQVDLFEQVNQANDRAREAADIIKYLDLEIQNYKRQVDMFGANTAPRDSGINTSKMLSRVNQIRQEIEQTQHRMSEMLSDHSGSLQNILKLPTQSKKTRMVQSIRSQISEIQQMTNSQRYDDSKEIIFQDTPLEPPSSFNAFVDNRHRKSESQQRNNKYAAYLERKKFERSVDRTIDKSLDKSFDKVPLVKKNLNPVQVRKQTPENKKFVPYYLRNPDLRPKKNNNYVPNFNVSGNSLVN